MAPKPQGQTALDEREIDDPELLKALDDREKAKGVKSEATSNFKTKDAISKDLLERHGVKTDEVYRVGRFRVSKSKRKGSKVAFETSASERLSITTVPDDD